MDRGERTLWCLCLRSALINNRTKFSPGNLASDLQIPLEQTTVEHFEGLLAFVKCLRAL